MLRIDRAKKSFLRLETPTLRDTEITERYDFQEFICNSPSEFFVELGEDLFLLAKEVVPSENVLDRIDLLALDREGHVVIIELKRGNHKLHMLQAISYAGMMSKWEPDDFLNLLDIDRLEKLLDFLEVGKEEINRKQRVILIAEAYDYALLMAAEWLSENYGVDVTCCRVSLAKDGDSEFLACSNVYPVPELAHQAIPRGRAKLIRKQKWSDWDTALAEVTNPSISRFFKKQVDAGHESYLPKRILRYRVNGKRRWFLAARRKNVYAWQNSRFTGDEEFWRNGLSQPQEVKPVKDGACLRFFLNTDEDLRFFDEAATTKLSSVPWIEGTGNGDPDDGEEGTDLS